jgi:hypothetical protein
MSLPVWKVKQLGAGKLGIECPRRACQGKAVVSGRKWKEARPEPTRSCTYCFRVAQLP